MFSKLSSTALYGFILALIATGASAAMNGPGHINVHQGGSVVGCLDQTMKWVIDGKCGVFTAETLTGPSSE